MPGTVIPPVPHRPPVAPTQEALEYADLAIIDLAKAETAEGRAELAVQLRGALSTHGFFYVINHGYTQAQNERIFDIADLPFTHFSEEEKREYAAKIVEGGSFQGFKARGFWVLSSLCTIDAGVRDQLEHYNINHDITRKQHPEVLRPLLPEIEAFITFNHVEILHKLLRLYAIGLEIPEDTFINQHNYSAPSYSIDFHYPRSEDDETKTKNTWLKGHTDIGSVTILWSQPVSALQIMSPDGKWRWIRHIENALVVNSGDAMEYLSGGFYKATIHRVVQPPPDQRGLTRLGVFYFAMTDDDVRLIPHAESPVLQRHGIVRRVPDASAPTMEAYRKGRTSSYGLIELQKKGNGVEEEIVAGIVVKHYH
ncbi:uncharacterized protein FIBRA_09133 [Fibroporia radiculosa]|uniref:Fe2OG dioxygenase domain-containing protein n=1 Tax=Fibroporia radiculosa TaxID=599839 RepID=J4GY02_9APHY|nr:uncharacterized protein FIBRA_09133 [Fibroporia radiculosa]CCM06830.1 predicted protein [Fibroporia radiculosa]